MKSCALSLPAPYNKPFVCAQNSKGRIAISMRIVLGRYVKRWNAKSEFWSSTDGHAAADNFVPIQLLTFRWLYLCTCRRAYIGTLL